MRPVDVPPDACPLRPCARAKTTLLFFFFFRTLASFFSLCWGSPITAPTDVCVLGPPVRWGSAKNFGKNIESMPLQAQSRRWPAIYHPARF